MADIVRTGPTDYEYGRTPSQFDIFGLLDAFTPVRRPVVTPSRTEYTEMDGALYGDTTPAEYGDPEFGFEYMPAYQAVSGLLADPMAAISAIPEAMAGQIEDYATATEGALQGYEGMITPEGEPIEANPLLPMEYLLGGSIGAMRAGENVLGAAGGRGLTKQDLDPMGYSKIRLDEPLAELDYDLAPASLLMPERKVVSPSDLQNKVILFGAGDRSGVGLLSRIGDTEFDEPVVALGGRDYQLATPYAWASDEGLITGLLNRAKRAQEETGIEDVLLAHSTMNPEAVDFTEMMSSTVAEMLKTAKISKKDAKKFDDDIRQVFEDFPGVKSPKFREWMATVPSGKARSVIIKKMDNAKRRDEGFPFIGKARYALTEEAQQNAPTFQSGLSFVPIDVEAGAVRNPSIRHATYDTAMERTGDPVQFSGTIPNEDVYRDFFKTLEGAVTKTGDPQPASMKQYTARASKPYQVVDQELVDTLSGLLGE